jgi:predicted Zn-dependent protease
VVAAHLLTVLGIEARVDRPWPLPDTCWIPTRGQVDAAKALGLLAEGLRPGRLRLGLVTADLCLPMLTYVFGEARVGGNVAIVSLHRLGPRPGAAAGGAVGGRGAGESAGGVGVAGVAGGRPGEGAGVASGAVGDRGAREPAGAVGVAGGALSSTGLERLAKVAVHEVAHARGLVHCRHAGCVMCAAPKLHHLDELRLQFCRACRERWVGLPAGPVPTG